MDDTPESVLARDPATLLASQLGVAVRYVTVVDRPDEIDGIRDSITARLGDSGLAPQEIEVLVNDDAAAALVRRARKTPGTVLAMATHGRTRTQKLVLGSVTSAVISHAGGPVLAVPPPSSGNNMAGMAAHLTGSGGVARRRLEQRDDPRTPGPHHEDRVRELLHVEGPPRPRFTALTKAAGDHRMTQRLEYHDRSALPTIKGLVAVVAHPDDETFGLGAVLSLAATLGVVREAWS